MIYKKIEISESKRTDTCTSLSVIYLGYSWYSFHHCHQQHLNHHHSYNTTFDLESSYSSAAWRRGWWGSVTLARLLLTYRPSEIPHNQLIDKINN